MSIRKVKYNLFRNFFLIIPLLLISCESDSDKILKTLNGRIIKHGDFENFITAQMAEYSVPGLAIAVVNGEEIIFHKNFGVDALNNSKQIDEKTIFEAASLSKPVFAYFVMKQIDKGLINLDTPLYTYVDYADISHDERYKLITPRMVLSHTSGLPNWRKDTLDFLYDPGTKYVYSGEGFQYLARATAAVNKVDRDGLYEVFKSDVATPLKATRFYFDWNDDVAKHKATGHKNGSVGSNGPSDFRTKEFGSAHNLHADIKSYARFINAMISGDKLLNTTYKEMLRAQVLIPEDDYEKKVLGNTHWSLGFGMKKTSNGFMYSHGGNNGFFTAFTIFYPKKKFGMVLFSNSEKIMFSNFTNEVAKYLETDLHMDMEELNKLLAKYN